MSHKLRYHRPANPNADIILDEDKVLYERGEDVLEIRGILDIARTMSRALVAGGFKGANPQAYAVAHQQVANPHLRFFVVHPQISKLYLDNEVLISPTYVQSEGAKREVKREHCLTHAYRHAKPVQRWDSIEASWLDLDGNIKKMRLTGLPAQIFQHESDHCEGITVWSKTIKSKRP